MNDDLVKRLRKRQEFEFIDGHKRVEWQDDDALEAADRIEELQVALQLAIEMRLTQKMYFKARTPDLLINSKMCEAAFDRAILEKTNDR